MTPHLRGMGSLHPSTTEAPAGLGWKDTPREPGFLGAKFKASKPLPIQPQIQQLSVPRGESLNPSEPRPLCSLKRAARGSGFSQNLEK